MSPSIRQEDKDNGAALFRIKSICLVDICQYKINVYLCVSSIVKMPSCFDLINKFVSFFPDVSVIHALCSRNISLDNLSDGLRCDTKLQELVYDILPSTTAVFSYAIGSRKLSANEQFLLVLKQSYQYPNLSDGAGRVGGQLRGDKECPFSGVTKSGRVWRKVPESDARSVV